MEMEYLSRDLENRKLNFFLAFIGIVGMSFAACIYFPWWIVAFCSAFPLFIIPMSARSAFICGFLALFCLWSGMSFWISQNNEHLLAQQLSILIMKVGNPLALVLLTGFVGGLVGGFAALSGRYLRILILGNR